MSAQQKQELRTSQSKLSRPDEYTSAPKRQDLQNSQSSLAGPNTNTTQYTNRIFLETVRRKPARTVNVLGAFSPQSPSAGPYFPPEVETSYLSTENNNRLTTENNNNIIL